MPLGILTSGLIGDVASPSKVLVVLPSGLVGEAAWAKFQKWQRIDYSANPKYNVVPS